jgi:hypothetical protein
VTVRAITRPDGGVSIVHPNLRALRAAETDDEYLRRVLPYEERYIFDEDGTILGDKPLPKLEEANLPDDAPPRRGEETLAELLARATPEEFRGLPFVDVDEATLPTDRSKRHAWRVRNGKVEVNPAVPAPPDPNADLRAAIASATSLADLKAALLADVDRPRRARNVEL